MPPRPLINFRSDEPQPIVTGSLRRLILEIALVVLLGIQSVGYYLNRREINALRSDIAASKGDAGELQNVKESLKALNIKVTALNQKVFPPTEQPPATSTIPPKPTSTTHNHKKTTGSHKITGNKKTTEDKKAAEDKKTSEDAPPQ